MYPENIDIFYSMLKVNVKVSCIEIYIRSFEQASTYNYYKIKADWENYIFKQLAKRLGQDNELVYFLTFEDTAILEAVNHHAENIFNYTLLPTNVPVDKRLYIIIDEVQYAKDPSNFLKLLYDKYAPKLKIIATGSSAFYIDKSFKDSLSGRKKVFEFFHWHLMSFCILKVKII